MKLKTKVPEEFLCRQLVTERALILCITYTLHKPVALTVILWSWTNFVSVATVGVEVTFRNVSES